MKYNLSHSKILDSLDDQSDEAQAARDAHLDEIESRMSRYGGRVVDRTRYNVTVEMKKPSRKFGDVDGDGDVDFDDLFAVPGAAIHKLFDFTIDTAQGFFGFVEAKAHDLKEWIDHIEADHEHGHGGS